MSLFKNGKVRLQERTSNNARMLETSRWSKAVFAVLISQIRRIAVRQVEGQREAAPERVQFHRPPSGDIKLHDKGSNAVYMHVFPAYANLITTYGRCMYYTYGASMISVCDEVWEFPAHTFTWQDL